MLLAVTCTIFIVVIVLLILYLLTLQKALSRVSPRYRLMEPGQVWLNLIPLFNLYWVFKTISSVSDSLKAEFKDRGEDDGSDYGKTIGITGQVIGLLSGAFSNIAQNSPIVLIGSVASLAALVLWIIYWVKVAGYSSRLDRGSRGGEDDDYDDRRGGSAHADDRIRE
jgi:hypothetical protein